MATGLLFLVLFLTARIWAPKLRDHFFVAVLIVFGLGALTLLRDLWW